MPPLDISHTITLQYRGGESNRRRYQLVKKMSISEGLNAGTFCAEMSSNQFGTDGRPLQLDKTLLGESNAEKVLGTLSVDVLVNFEADEATSKIVNKAPAVRSRLKEVESGKRKSKPTEPWLAYQTSQL